MPRPREGQWSAAVSASRVLVYVLDFAVRAVQGAFPVTHTASVTLAVDVQR